MNDTIRNQLVQIRREKGMTQEALAQQLEVDASCLSKWERGVNKFPLDMIPAYAKALGLNLQFNQKGEMIIRTNTRTIQYSKDYEEFSVNRVKEAMEIAASNRPYEERSGRLQDLLDQYQLVFCSENGYPMDLTTIAFWVANDYETDRFFCLTSTVHPEAPQLLIRCEGSMEAEAFELQRLLAKAEALYSHSIMKEIEKAFYYACAFEYRGLDVLRWAKTFFPNEEHRRVATETLFPYLSEASFEALLALTEYENWLYHCDHCSSFEVKTLCYLGLVDAENEKEWVIQWTDEEESIEMEEVLFCLDDVIFLAIEEWKDRFEEK